MFVTTSTDGSDPKEPKLAKLKEQVYKDPRPAETFEIHHRRVRERSPDFIYLVTRCVTFIPTVLLFRLRVQRIENVPATGPVIFAPNHFSFFDHFFLAMYTRRKVHFMSKSQLFNRVSGWVFRHGGTYPVRRGHRDEEAFTTTRAILDRGGTIGMYCEGGRSRTAKVSDQARPGIGRIILDTGATVVPTAIYGSAKARNWKRLQFSPVTVRFGEPIRWEAIPNSTREQQQAVADEVLSQIRALYGALERDLEGKQ